MRQLLQQRFQKRKEPGRDEEYGSLTFIDRSHGLAGGNMWRDIARHNPLSAPLMKLGPAPYNSGLDLSPRVPRRPAPATTSGSAGLPTNTLRFAFRTYRTRALYIIFFRELLKLSVLTFYISFIITFSYFKLLLFISLLLLNLFNIPSFTRIVPIAYLLIGGFFIL